MTVKEYLNQVREYEEWYKSELEHIKEVRETITSLGGFDYSKDQVQTSKKGDGIEKAIIRLMNAEDRLAKDCKMYYDFREQTIRQIQELSNVMHRRILYKRYIEGQDFYRISMDIEKDYWYTCKLHGDALKSFDKLYNITGRKP